MYNVRVAMRQRYPGEARNAIAAVFASTADVKHVFVVDEDIDVYDDAQIDLALATRFQAESRPRRPIRAFGPSVPSLDASASARKAASI